MVEWPAGYLLRLLRANPWPGVSHPVTYLIIRRPYTHLQDQLRRADMTVIVDRRSHERREVRQPVTVERRHAERRTKMEELGEIVIVNGGA